MTKIEGSRTIYSPGGVACRLVGDRSTTGEVDKRFQPPTGTQEINCVCHQLSSPFAIPQKQGTRELPREFPFNFV